MPQTVLCPNPNELQQFALGLLPESAAEPLGQHLLTCPYCVETLNNLRPKDTLLDALRGNGENQAQEPPAVEALMARLTHTLPQLIPSGAVACQHTDEAIPDQIGRYQILGRLGAGGMGTVYRANDGRLDREVAVKVPRFDGPKDVVAACRQRFHREARAAAAVRNPHVCPIYDVGEQDGQPYVVMALVEGCTLAERMKEKILLHWREAAALGVQAAEALAAVHAAGIIHRDLKPSNILLDRNGLALLTDFGLARAERDPNHLTPRDALLGTPAYMAPEQALGNAADSRCDLFSLGVVLYELCTGQLPFRGNTSLAVMNALTSLTPIPAAQLNPAVPTVLSELVQHLLAKNPAQRPPSARAVVERLEGLLKQTPLQTRTESTASRKPLAAVSQSDGGKRPRRRLLLAALAALLLLAPLAYLYGGTVVRVVTNKGELFIESSDPDVVVTVKDGAATVYDKAKGRSFVLTAGDYDVEVREAGESGLRFDTKRFTITRGGKETFYAVLKPKGKPDDAVNEEPISKPPTSDEIKDADRTAAQWVLSIGGSVMVNEEEREIKNATDLPLEAFRLSGVVLRDNTRVNDAGLIRFSNCKYLTTLDLYGTHVTEKGLANFKACNDLRNLGLEFTQVNDQGLAYFKDCKNLNSLRLWEAPLVSELGLSAFKDCKKLTLLWLYPTKKNKAGLAYFQNCKEISDLTLNGPNVGDAELVHFKDCKNLTKLNLNFTQASETGLAYFKDCTNLIDFELNLTKATDAYLAQFGTLNNLEVITLDGTQISNASLIQLKDCKLLRFVSLNGTQVR